MTIVETMHSDETGMNRVTMTIINPRTLKSDFRNSNNENKKFYEIHADLHINEIISVKKRGGLMHLQKISAQVSLRACRAG